MIDDNSLPSLTRTSPLPKAFRDFRGGRIYILLVLNTLDLPCTYETCTDHFETTTDNMTRIEAL